MGFKADSVLMFIAIFTGLFGLYAGQTSQHSLTALQTLPAPVPIPVPVRGCAVTDTLCQITPGANAVALATAYVGWAILSVGSILGYLVVEGILFLNIALGFAFDPNFNPNGVPVIGFFFTGLIFIVIMEVFRIFRGSSSGF